MSLQFDFKDQLAASPQVTPFRVAGFFAVADVPYCRAMIRNRCGGATRRVTMMVHDDNAGPEAEAPVGAQPTLWPGDKGSFAVLSEHVDMRDGALSIQVVQEGFIDRTEEHAGTVIGDHRHAPWSTRRLRRGAICRPRTPRRYSGFNGVNGTR